MIKEYSQNRNNVIINFSLKYCDNSKGLLNSTGFKKVFTKYTSIIQKKDTVLYNSVEKLTNGKDVVKTFTELFKMLIILDKKEVSLLNSDYKLLLKNTDLLVEFIEGLYTYWRSLERYAIIQSDNSESGIQSVNFIEANNGFANLVLSTYRIIEENVIGYKHSVYRQLSAGINAGVVLSNTTKNMPKELDNLNGVSIIKSIVLTPPFVIYPKRNKRSGVFNEVFSNPLEGLELNKSHYFCYPAKVGNSLAFIYFHRDFMNHGISLCNLFELAKFDEFKYKTPNLVYVFGQKIKENKNVTSFYHDKVNDVYVGFASSSDEIDYFGYMKKMILTLHNVRMLDSNSLPIHGAMVNITLKNGKQANIAIMGDSGAGKSESLEAFRTLSDKYLKDFKIVFDDMGSFKIENGKVYGYGTEIGAFVRLDDLEPGYAFKEMDRAIFMSPNKINARLLYPVSTYSEITKGYKVDMFLYANNYENNNESLKLFSDKNEAIDVFRKGLRKAKGTTTEVGLVESYFANPFGVVQRQEQSEILIEKTFSKLFDTNVEVGEIYTKLAIDGYEQKGPETAAIKLFEWIMK